MTTDLLTVSPTDRLDLAALVMDRRGIRQLLVVDEAGRLLGLVSYRALLRLVATHRAGDIEDCGPVEAFMVPDPVTVSPGTLLTDAIQVMLDRNVSVVPVVDGDRVVGILSEHDVVRVAGRLLGLPPNDRPARS